MSITLDSVYELKLHSFCKDQLGLNVLHYRCTALTGAPPTESKAAELLSTAFAPVTKDLLSAEASFLGVSLRQLFPILGIPIIMTVDAGAGTGGVSVLPKQVAGLIKKVSGLAGKANRGRVYIPFPSESDNDTFGTPNAAYRTRLSDFGFQMASIRTGGLWLAATLTPIIYHKTAPATHTAITDFTVRSRWANQRRRGDFGRSNPATVS